MYKRKTNTLTSQSLFCTKHILFLVVNLVCVLFILFPSSVWAQGVTAGTLINNIATVSYTVNNIEQEPINSSPTGNSLGGNSNGTATQFVVDRKIDLIVTSNANTNINPGDGQAELSFTLENQGNAIQEFSLAVDNLLVTDNFDPNSCSIEVTGVSGTPVTGVVLPTTGNITLDADQQASISVSCDIPLHNNGTPIQSGDTAAISLISTVERNEDNTVTVESQNSETADLIDTVFVDGAGTDDAIRDAQHSARASYIASTGTLPPTLTIDKSIVSMVDPNGGSSAITGSEVTYRIEVNTAGIGTIENLVITDPTPADMTYKANSITLNNINQSDANDAADNTDFGVSNNNTATIDIGSVTAGSQYAIQLTYIIN